MKQSGWWQCWVNILREVGRALQRSKNEFIPSSTKKGDIWKSVWGRTMPILFSKQEVSAVFCAEGASGKMVSGEGRRRTDSVRGSQTPSLWYCVRREKETGPQFNSCGRKWGGGKKSQLQSLEHRVKMYCKQMGSSMVYAKEVPSSIGFQSRNARTIQRCHFSFWLSFPCFQRDTISTFT